MKLVIIANPVSGRGRAYRVIQNYFSRWTNPDWDVEVQTTLRSGHAGLLALELLQNPPDLLAICSGDGTVNEVASAIPNPPFPVALLPAGTANVLARELEIPLHPVKALKIALKRVVRRVDLGEIRDGGRSFLFVAGIGFDAFAVDQVRPALKKTLGMAAYAAAIVSCLRSYSFPEFQVIGDGKTYAATSCLACNARSYGGGLLFCPEADLADGQLDIMFLEGARRFRLALFLLKAWLGNAGTGNWIHRLRARELRIEGPAGVLVQADGELAGGLPLKIGIRDQAFPLVIPRKH